MVREQDCPGRTHVVRQAYRALAALSKPRGAAGGGFAGITASQGPGPDNEGLTGPREKVVNKGAGVWRPLRSVKIIWDYTQGSCLASGGGP
jgi:hypothetical protein